MSGRVTSLPLCRSFCLPSEAYDVGGNVASCGFRRQVEPEHFVHFLFGLLSLPSQPMKLTLVSSGEMGMWNVQRFSTPLGPVREAKEAFLVFLQCHTSPPQLPQLALVASAIICLSRTCKWGHIHLASNAETVLCRSNPIRVAGCICNRARLPTLAKRHSIRRRSAHDASAVVGTCAACYSRALMWTWEEPHHDWETRALLHMRHIDWRYAGADTCACLGRPGAPSRAPRMEHGTWFKQGACTSGSPIASANTSQRMRGLPHEYAHRHPDPGGHARAQAPSPAAASSNAATCNPAARIAGVDAVNANMCWSGRPRSLL